MRRMESGLYGKTVITKNGRKVRLGQRLLYGAEYKAGDNVLVISPSDNVHTSGQLWEITRNDEPRAQGDLGCLHYRGPFVTSKLPELTEGATYYNTVEHAFGGGTYRRCLHVYLVSSADL